MRFFFFQKVRNSVFLPLFLLIFSFATFAQNTGSLRGAVTMTNGTAPLHGVQVRIVELGSTAITDESGKYEFATIPPGAYTVLARMDGFRDMSSAVTISAGTVTAADFDLRLMGPREQVTVTATGVEEVAYESFKVVSTLDSVQLAENPRASIGEVLEAQPGVSKRSYGPGPSRPVIRGFDGDRVLILQDGARTGSLSSQSGDHAEPIDPLSLERLEVVKGPSTLLYGSNAIGGVVNAITGHDHSHPGLRSSLTGVAGSNNSYGGGNGSFEYGHHQWLVWGGGGGQRTGNYQTPLGEIFNSNTRVSSTNAGFGRFGEKAFFSLGYDYENARYGIPIGAEPPGALSRDEEIIDLSMHRHNIPVRFGLLNLGSFVDTLRVSMNYNQYHHEEINRGLVDTIFDNKEFSYRTSFDQKREGILSGSFGFEGWRRDYKVTGEEAISPPVTSNVFALFGLQEVDLGSVRFQFGGRYENTRYNPEGLENRAFNGFSGAAGIHVSLTEATSVLLNYTHSDRTPALEELFNNGPHAGNLTFEIGNPNLDLERGDGIEISLRNSSSRLRGEANFYYYNLRNFVYLAPTGEIEDGLNVANYAQADSRFLGGELSLNIGLHPDFWLNLGLDGVSARLKESDTALPRIPPVRGRIGFEAQWKGLRITPELILSNAQSEIFPTETATAGYAVIHWNASYTVAQQHMVHVFSVNAFNLGDRFYQNHLSFIKDIAPEQGRGLRFSYTMRFF